MQHNGWTYDWNDDHSDDDVRKIEHVATHEDGRKVVMDLSPYLRSCPLDIFRYMVELGFPDRSAIKSNGPVQEEDVLRLWIEKLNARKGEQDG